MPIDNYAADIRSLVPKFGDDANAIRIINVPLDNALVGKRLDVTGTFLWVVAASSKTATADVAIQEQIQDTIPFKEGFFVSGLRFAQIYITCSAQPGEYLTLMFGRETGAGIKIQNPASQMTDVSIIKATGLDTYVDIPLVAGVATNIHVANPLRHEVIIKNLSTNLGVIRIGGLGVAVNAGIELMPGESITMQTTESIWGFSVGGESVCAIEIND